MEYFDIVRCRVCIFFDEYYNKKDYDGKCILSGIIIGCIIGIGYNGCDIEKCVLEGFGIGVNFDWVLILEYDFYEDW